MPKTIMDCILERKAELIADPVLATQNMALAMAAMRDGIKSDAWQHYMTQFVEQNPPGRPVDPDQLARLTAKDGTLGDQVLDRQRAYLVANSICGPSTVTTIDFGVDTIDFTLANVGHIDRPALDCQTTTLTTTGGEAAAPKPTVRRGSKASKKPVKKTASKAVARYNSAS